MAASPVEAYADPATPRSSRLRDRAKLRGHQLPGAVWFVLAGVVVILTAVSQQGGDLLWGVALGDRARAGHSVAGRLSFAPASSADWANPMVLGEVVLSVVHSLGPWALVILHLVLVTAALGTLLAHCVATGRPDSRMSMALILVTVGGITAFGIARMPSLSLLPYAALVVLLLREADRPSRRLWLAVPLLAVWGNLHGGVLVGCALLGVHLVCCRGPLPRRAAVGVSALGAVLLATSAGWRTIIYYRGVLGNEAARQHSGLWAPASWRTPTDVVMTLAVVALIAMWLRSRPRLWETVAVVGMSTATLLASRNSIWLLLFLLPLAARGHRREKVDMRRNFSLKPAAAAFVLLLLGTAWQIDSRGSTLGAAGMDAVATVRTLAHGGSVLAISPDEETFAQAGIRIWAGNPIDAFPQQVQREYLAFLHRGSIPSTPPVDLIVVDSEHVSQVREAGWRQVAVISKLHFFKPPATSRKSAH